MGSTILDQQAKKLQDEVDLHQAYFQTFTTPQGKRVIEDLCQRFHVFKPTKFKSTEEVLIEKGMRELVLSIIDETFKDLNEKINVLRELQQK